MQFLFISALFAVAASAASLRSLPKECSQVSNGYFVEASCQRTTSWVTEFSAQHEVTAAAGAPEQFWINYGFTPDVMVIGYITSDMTAASTVKYGTSSGSYPNVVSGNSTSYTYGKYKSGLIHHVYLTGLTANTKYYYQAGSDASWSQEFTFTSNPGIGANIPYKFAIVADIGENRDANNTITHVLADVDTIDSVIIAGDISYASGCESNGCTTWDAFQTMAAPLGAIKPWHVNIGNHETYDSANGIVAISTKYRFAGMPTPTAYNADGAMYYSYEAGPAHVISISSFYPGGFGSSSPLTTWLTADLAKVDRSQTPWLLVALHAPWYNTNSAHQGDGEAMRAALEPMLISAKVDVVFTGHVHAYERTCPVNNFKCDQTNGITHFNVGDAGASLYTTWLKAQPWSLFHKASFGHGNFQIFNATTAQWTWHENSNAESQISDSVFVTCKA